jgi:hypothetical protein
VNKSTVVRGKINSQLETVTVVAASSCRIRNCADSLSSIEADARLITIDELDAGGWMARNENARAANDAGVKRYFRRERRGLRKQTPSPVPFSSMNSTPANSSARLSTARVA